MAVHSAQIRVSTEGDGDIIDITRGVHEVVETAAVMDGIVNVFVAHSTAAITLIEYEPGGVRDLRELMEKLVPTDDDYHHNRTAGDSNARGPRRPQRRLDCPPGPLGVGVVLYLYLFTGAWVKSTFSLAM